MQYLPIPRIPVCMQTEQTVVKLRKIIILQCVFVLVWHVALTTWNCCAHARCLARQLFVSLNNQLVVSDDIVCACLTFIPFIVCRHKFRVFGLHYTFVVNQVSRHDD